MEETNEELKAMESALRDMHAYAIERDDEEWTDEFIMYKVDKYKHYLDDTLSQAVADERYRSAALVRDLKSEFFGSSKK